MSADALAFEEQSFAEEVLKISACESVLSAAFRRRCRALFGVSIRVLAFVWLRLQERNNGIPVGARVHLLMAMNFLKNYDVEEASARRFGVTEKTFRERARDLVFALASLGMVAQAARL